MALHVYVEAAGPQSVALTTPNAAYNLRFPTLAAGAFRHADHRFEWTRDELEAWDERVAAAHGYQVTIAPVGPGTLRLGRRASSRYSGGAIRRHVPITLTRLSDFVLNITLLR